MRCGRARRAVVWVGAALASWVVADAEDPQTGLVIDKGYELVKGQCTICHSARLITQAGKTRDGWVHSIRWMQRTQGLWDLGPYESQILDYLSANYGVPPAAGPGRPPVMPLK